MTITRRDILKLSGLTVAGGFVPLATFSSEASENIPTEFQPIKSAFNPMIAEWEIDWPGKISQYDVVYLSPPIDPMQGIPVGNGEIGVLFWCEDSKIIAVINKSNLWDDASFDRFHNWNKEEEDYSTTLRHACRIIIDFKFPVFNTLYLSDFNARINLADGSLTLDADSPFGRVSLNAFVDHKTGMLFYDVKSDFEENIPVDVAIERYGSRTFSHWYSQINRDASIGISGTEAISDQDGAYITQELSGSSFAVGGRSLVSNGLEVSYVREHSRRVSIELKGNKKKETQLAFSVTTSDTSDTLLQVKKKLADVFKIGMGDYKRSNEAAWESIWYRSFMDYGDDYLNNLWYLTMYYAHASQGGNYPGRFNNGLWGWNRDVQNWNFYFHWNQQQLYWPLNAAGFPELIKPYLDFRFNSLPHAKQDAKKYFNSDGAFISDVAERRGYNSISELHNHTPVVEIALDFWRQYQYTGDKKFLIEKALPFILEASKFFESLLIQESDGMYHAKEGSGYEGRIMMKDGLTELVYARALFTTVLEALKVADTYSPKAVKWKEILDHLAQLPVVPAGDASIEHKGSGYELNRGLFKGETSPANEIFAAGWGIKENKWLTVYNPVNDTTNHGFKLLDGIFPSVPSSPIFPSGVIGLGQKGSQDFEIATATTLLYAPEITGWDPVPIVLARLGLAKELSVDLERFPERWQTYCNGWGQWGMGGEVRDAEYLMFRTKMVRDIAAPEEEKFPFPMSPFRHMSMESMSVLATAMNESLLQSYDGTLRFFPAFPATKKGRFTLHAEGGFVVSSEIRSGKVQWICIKSLLGNPCKLALPWNKAVIHSNLKIKSQMMQGIMTEIKTKASEIIMILPEGKNIKRWSLVSEKPLPNEIVKYHSSGQSQLGLPRMF